MMLAFTSAAIFILSYTFKKRFPIKQYTIPYLTAMGMNVLIYAINIWGDQWVYTSLTPALLRWLAAAFVIANLYYVARQYYTLIGLENSFHRLSECPGALPLADDGTFFPPASRSRRFRCRLLRFTEYRRIYSNGTGYAVASESTANTSFNFWNRSC